MEGQVGRVTGIDEQDPTRLCIQFDSIRIYEWLDSHKSLPSTWMDELEPAQTLMDKELLEVMEKVTTLLIKAASQGELRVAKLLRIWQGLDMDVQNAEGMTMLHIACEKGHKEFVDWLLNEVQVDVEKTDKKGFRAIHYASMG